MLAPRQRPARRDANEAEILKVLRQCGVLTWQSLPIDILWFYRGKLGAMEIKDGNKPPSARMLTPPEREFIEATGSPVVLSIEDALREVCK
jgi:hypothetical protein